MLVKSNNRREAYQALINMVLKDNRKYCNTCGRDYDPNLKIPCCENPQVGTNADFTAICVREVKDIKENLKNDYASFSDKSMRWGLKLPPCIYEALTEYEKKHGRKFINDEKDIVWFGRNFPQFAIPKKF